MRRFRRLTAVVLATLTTGLWTSWPHHALAETKEPPPRNALIIGIGTYDDLSLRLKNPIHDAQDLHERLTTLGWNAGKPLMDPTRAELEDGIASFAASLPPGAISLVYYAGHGFDLQREIHLMPRDFKSTLDGALASRRAVGVQYLVQVLAQKKLTAAAFVFDACRENMLSTRGARVVSAPDSVNGLTGGFLYATAQGGTASDNPQGRNGLFTTYLLRALQDDPSATLDDVFDRVADQLTERDQYAQFTKLGRGLKFPFNGIPRLDSAANKALVAEQTLFYSIKESENPKKLRSYLETYGDAGVFATQVRSLLTAVEKQRADFSGSWIGEVTEEYPQRSYYHVSVDLRENEDGAFVLSGQTSELDLDGKKQRAQFSYVGPIAGGKLLAEEVSRRYVNKDGKPVQDIPSRAKLQAQVIDGKLKGQWDGDGTRAVFALYRPTSSVQAQQILQTQPLTGEKGSSFWSTLGKVAIGTAVVGGLVAAGMAADGAKPGASPSPNPYAWTPTATTGFVAVASKCTWYACQLPRIGSTYCSTHKCQVLGCNNLKLAGSYCLLHKPKS